MTRAYYGKNTYASIRPVMEEEAFLIVESRPEEMNYILRILEGYSHLTLPVQLDPTKGRLGLHTTRCQVR